MTAERLVAVAYGCVFGGAIVVGWLLARAVVLAKKCGCLWCKTQLP